MKKFLLVMLVTAAIDVFLIVGTPNPVSAKHRLAVQSPSANHSQSGATNSHSALIAALDTIAVPEVGGLLLMGSGLLAGAVYLRKKYFDTGK